MTDYRVSCAAVMGILLCVFGREERLTFLAPALIFGVLIGVSGIFPFALGASHLLLGVNGAIPRLDVAVASLFLVAWSIAKPGDVPTLRTPLRLLLALNVSLLVVRLLAWLYESALENADLVVVEAVVIAVAILGEILLSSHSITNIDSPCFSRRSRVFLFFSFVAITLATVLLWAPLYEPNEKLRELQTLNKSGIRGAAWHPYA